MASPPAAKQIHVIADNLTAHKTQRVDAFQAPHPRVYLHFTPTYSSWLNQVELWFAKIERDVIARGVFTSARSDAKAHPIRPSVQQQRPSRGAEVLRSSAKNYS